MLKRSRRSRSFLGINKRRYSNGHEDHEALFLLKFGNGNEAMVRLVISIEIAASSCTHNTGLPVKLKFQITGISREQYEFLINNTEMKTLIRFQI